MSTSNTQPAYSTSASSAEAFKNVCGQVHPVQTMRVPVYKHVIHRRPVVYETVSREMSYVEVPIQHNYEQRDYQMSTVQQCEVAQAPCQPQPRCC